MPVFLILLSGCGQNKAIVGQIKSQAITPITEAPSQSVIQPTTGDSLPKNNDVPATPVSPGLTLVEVAKHNSALDCWMVINNKVYDLSTYIKLGIHPGGDTVIKGCGQEASAMFTAVDKHQKKATNELENYLLGNLQ